MGTGRVGRLGASPLYSAYVVSTYPRKVEFGWIHTIIEEDGKPVIPVIAVGLSVETRRRGNRLCDRRGQELARIRNRDLLLTWGGVTGSARVLSKQSRPVWAEPEDWHYEDALVDLLPRDLDDVE